MCCVVRVSKVQSSAMRRGLRTVKATRTRWNWLRTQIRSSSLKLKTNSTNFAGTRPNSGINPDFFFGGGVGQILFEDKLLQIHLHWYMMPDGRKSKLKTRGWVLERGHRALPTSCRESGKRSKLIRGRKRIMGMKSWYFCYWRRAIAPLNPSSWAQHHCDQKIFETSVRLAKHTFMNHILKQSQWMTVVADRGLRYTCTQQNDRFLALSFGRRITKSWWSF